MTKSFSSQMEPEKIIGRALKQGETLVPLRELISIIHSEVEDEAVGYFILSNCYTKNYKESLLTYEDDADDKKRLEPMRHGPAKRVPWRNNICLARFDTNWDPCDGIHVVNIEDNEGILIAGSTKFNEDETFAETDPNDELPIYWKEGKTCPKLYTYGDAFVFQNIRPDIVSTTFLLRALTSNEVCVQAQNMDKPIYIREIVGYDEEDFLSLMIPLPSMKEQHFLISMDHQRYSSADCKEVLMKYLRIRMKEVGVDEAKMELLSYFCENSKEIDAEVINTLPKLKRDVLTENDMFVLKYFPDEVCNFAFTPFKGLKNDFWDAPRELSDFMFNKLIDSEGEKIVVYNPYTNYGSLALHNAIFVGEEKNAKARAIAKVRLCITRIENHIELSDPLESDEKKYKHILSMPPFIKSLDQIVSKLYDKLEDGGRMVLCVPLNFLKSPDGRIGIRQRLLEAHALCSIYVMPEGLFKPYTDIQVAVLVVIKGRTNNNVVMFDYSFAKTTEHENNGERIAFDNDIVEDSMEPYLLGEQSELAFSIAVPSEQILRTGDQGYYELNPLSHLAERRVKRELSNAHFFKLGDLVECSLGQRATEPVRVVKLQHFNQEESAFERDFKELSLTQPAGPCRILEGDVLLFPNIGKCVKGICFRHKDEFPVAFFSDRILSLKPRSEKVSLEYLVCELNGSDYVKIQIDAKTAGNALQKLRRNDLMGILIDVPSKAEQAKRVEAYKVAELEKMLGKKGLEIKRQHDEYVRRVRSRKHAIGNVLGEVVPAFDGLVDCFNEHDGKLNASDLVWKGFDDTVGSVIDKLQKEICRLAEMVSNMTNAVDVEFGAPVEYMVKDLVDGYINSHVFNRCSKRMNFNEEMFADVLGENGEVAIKVCKDDFNKVLDNIVTNAVKHGFTDDGKTYLIEFDVVPTEMNGCLAVGISVRNNGKPLPKGMTVEKVFQEGQTTSGSFGIGGWFVKSAVEHFGGEVSMKTYNPDENEFPIEYVLKFPISNL